MRWTYENKSFNLCFGNYGIQAIEKGFLTAQQIEAVRRTIASRLKRKAKIWIRAYPDSAKTKKPLEVRRGRGKGNIDHWYCFIKPGRILFEMQISLRYLPLLNKAIYFAMRKLPRFSQLIERVVKL